jgi:hypothetical protein
MIGLAVLGFCGTALIIPQWLQTVPSLPHVLTLSGRDTVSGDTIALLQLPVQGDPLHQAITNWNGAPTCELTLNANDTIVIPALVRLVEVCDNTSSANRMRDCSTFAIPMNDIGQRGLFHVKLRTALRDKWRPTREVTFWWDPEAGTDPEWNGKAACVIVIPGADTITLRALATMAWLQDSLRTRAFSPRCRSFMISLDPGTKAGGPFPSIVRPPEGGGDVRLGVGNFMMNRHPVLLFWLTMVSIMVAFAMGSAPLSWDLMHTLRTECSIPKRVMIQNALIACAVVAALAVIPLGMRGVFTPDLMAEHFKVVFETPLALLMPIVITLMCSAGPIAAMFTVSSCARDLDWNDEFPERIPAKRKQAMKGDVVRATVPDRLELEDRLMRLKKLGATLRACLSILALLVVFAVITSGLLRESFIAWVSVPGLDLFPERFVRAYGMMFAAFLAILYVPVRLHLRSVIAEVETMLDAHGLDPKATVVHEKEVVATDSAQTAAVTDTANAAHERLGDEEDPGLQEEKATGVAKEPPANGTRVAMAESPRTLLDRLGVTDLPWAEIRALLVVLSPILGSLIPEWLQDWFN